MPRMKILNSIEREAFELPPIFSSVERKRNFDFPDEVNLAGYTKQTLQRHQASILDFYGFRPFKPHGQALLVEELARLARSHFKPRLLFSRSIEMLAREKVEIPVYFRINRSNPCSMDQRSTRTVSSTLPTASSGFQEGKCAEIYASQGAQENSAVLLYVH